MSVFAPTRRLDVFRRFASGERTLAGQLAQNRHGVFFQYDGDYVRRHPGLSPFALPLDGALRPAPPTPHGGLFGVFADSLPDSWGTRVMDRVLRQHGVLPGQVTGMDRLAYVGDRGMGALEYAPAQVYGSPGAPQVALGVLGEEALALFEDTGGRGQAAGRAIAAAASSGGARPKAQIWLSGDPRGAVHLRPGNGLTPWLVKFTSSLLPLGHEESLCEAAYLALAVRAGIDVPAWRLLPAPRSSPGIAWLAQQRFDCQGEHGRYHMHSLCGLLDADFRSPSMDYEDLLKASIVLCRSPAAGQRQFARALFNLFALNQDDHTRNWSFLQDDSGVWQPTPFYDVTFSPTPSREHATAYVGHGAAPPLAAMQRLADEACFASWSNARAVIERVVDALGAWGEVAAELGVRKRTRTMIGRQLDAERERNRHLLTPLGKPRRSRRAGCSSSPTAAAARLPGEPA